MKLLKKINGKHTGLFAAGLLLGTAGVKILSSKDAKNVYTKGTAAVLRYLSKNTCRFARVFFVYLRGDRYEI